MMKQSLPGRELILLDGGSGVRVCGTYHTPRNDGAPVSPRGQVGVVFINTLSDPRSGGGDTAVYWAESLATSGYPAFRLDLPGLGDTEGEIPYELLSFIADKGFVPVMNSAFNELVARFELSGVVLVGHCAGAVSALYSATECKVTKGAILMDPYFTRPKWITAKIQPGLVHFARKSFLGSMLRRGFDSVLDMLRRIRREELPKNANTELFSTWMQAASRGLPILVLQSSGLASAAGQFDYVEYALTLAGKKSQVSVERIEGTDHSFSDLAGRQAVSRCLETWMERFQPVTMVEHAFASLPVAVSDKDGLSNECVPA